MAILNSTVINGDLSVTGDFKTNSRSFNGNVTVNGNLNATGVLQQNGVSLVNLVFSGTGYFYFTNNGIGLYYIRSQNSNQLFSITNGYDPTLIQAHSGIFLYQEVDSRVGIARGIIDNSTDIQNIATDKAIAVYNENSAIQVYKIG